MNHFMLVIYGFHIPQHKIFDFQTACMIIYKNIHSSIYLIVGAYVPQWEKTGPVLDNLCRMNVHLYDIYTGTRPFVDIYIQYVDKV